MPNWFRQAARPETAIARPAIAPDLRLYAVGDVHGRRDLLRRLHAMIADDARAAPQPRKRVVYLGDYIDRGPDSGGVIDLLIDEPLGGFERVHLEGNHEHAMLGFLVDIRFGPMWLGNGGDATLTSYGIPVPNPGHPGELLDTQERLAACLPEAHRAFLRSLELTHGEGDYFFVHAGVRPGTPLDRQNSEDLLWIREPFLGSRAGFGKVVVHGHTISPQPEICDNRVGIDTGAYASGHLTCLVLAGTTRTVLQT
ncbi:MAG TPA: metallophosphoesterase family protein [Stellaceae bacterium]|nr:metallophosphoesterase family protein [Stellaceae bacterium]